MRITIDIDDRQVAATTLVPAAGKATDAGGPPAALLQPLSVHAPDSPERPKAGNDAGPPPQHLLHALLSTASPRANGAGASDGGPAPG